MVWWIYGLLFLLALLVSASAIYAFFWASRTGQLRDFDAQSRSIFDPAEPEGVQSDFFPRKPRRLHKRPASAALPDLRNEP